MKVMICISSKSPNKYLHECIRCLYEKLILDYEIHVVDSDSEDHTYYERVAIDFPLVKIHYIKNKNYEYGAWKYILEKYPTFDTYVCIQDSLILQQPIDLTKVNDKVAYTFHCNVGYLNFHESKPYGIECLKLGDISCRLVDTYFTIATHNSFVVSRHTLEDMFKCLIVPPESKFGSCSYERIFGLYFLEKRIHTIDMTPWVRKEHGGRL